MRPPKYGCRDFGRAALTGLPKTTTRTSGRCRRCCRTRTTGIYSICCPWSRRRTRRLRRTAVGGPAGLITPRTAARENGLLNACGTCRASDGLPTDLRDVLFSGRSAAADCVMTAAPTITDKNNIVAVCRPRPCKIAAKNPRRRRRRRPPCARRVVCRCRPGRPSRFSRPQRGRLCRPPPSSSW